MTHQSSSYISDCMCEIEVPVVEKIFFVVVGRKKNFLLMMIQEKKKFFVDDTREKNEK